MGRLGVVTLVMVVAFAWATAAAVVKPDAEERDALACDVFAQHNMGLRHAEGRRAPQNFDEAARWYRMAARQGYPYSQYELGYLYESGQGVARNPRIAIQWYRKAAAQGSSTAQ